MKEKIRAGQDTVKAVAAAPDKKAAQGTKAQNVPSSSVQDQPKKKNRKRVQERLAAQEAAKNAKDSSSEENE